MLDVIEFSEFLLRFRTIVQSIFLFLSIILTMPSAFAAELEFHDISAFLSVSAAQEDCPICLENLKPVGAPLFTTACCGKQFHFDCLSRINGFQNRSAICPLCRQGIFGRAAPKEPVRSPLQMSHSEFLEALSNITVESLLGTFVQVRDVSFLMGSPANESGRYDGETQHRVILSPFEVAEAAVTQRAYVFVMGMNPSRFKESTDCPENWMSFETSPGRWVNACADHPVEKVSWNDAQEFIQRLNQVFGATGGSPFRLPTEAQQEYAFRGGTSTAFISGETDRELEEYLWYDRNSGQKTHPVKSRRANAFGIYRSSVWEWGNDWHGVYPRSHSTSVTDPVGPASGLRRVARGGSWHSEARNCRSAFRSSGIPGYRYEFVGFRLVRQ